MLLFDHPKEHNKTVLIIDDDDRNFFSLAALLKTRGFRCISATNSAEAFSVLQKTPKVHAILMDIMMPGIDGIETTRRIKSEQDFAHIPIIVQSALTTREDSDKAMAAGAAAYITKPIDFDRLLDLFQQHLPKE